MRRISLFLLPLLAAPIGAQAEEIDHAAQYAACMALAERNAEQAFDSALAWRDLGGGDAAEHCIAKSLMWLKQYAEAARRFEELGQRVKAEAPMRAALFDQAAQAWLLAGDAERADDVLGAAITLVGDDPALFVDRARARAAMQRWWDTVDDLNRAIELDPLRAEAYVYRASAYRYLDSLDLARADIDRALELGPNDPRAYLERGILRRLAGDKDGARKDWVAAIGLEPGTETARTAQRNIERLELDAEK